MVQDSRHVRMEIHVLEQRLPFTKPTRTQRRKPQFALCMLSGFPGSGKSTLAQQYLTRYGFRYRQCWRLPGSRRAFLRTWRTYAEEEGFIRAGPNEARDTLSPLQLRLIRANLERCQDSWLLSIDGVNDLEFIQWLSTHVLPVEGRGHILITSRLLRGVNRHAVYQLPGTATMNDACHLFYRELHQPSRHVHSFMDPSAMYETTDAPVSDTEYQLVCQLGLVPGALMEAARYVRTHGCPLRRALELACQSYESLFHQLLPTLTQQWRQFLDRIFAQRAQTREVVQLVAHAPFAGGVLIDLVNMCTNWDLAPTDPPEFKPLYYYMVVRVDYNMFVLRMENALLWLFVQHAYPVDAETKRRWIQMTRGLIARQNLDRMKRAQLKTMLVEWERQE